MPIMIRKIHDLNYFTHSIHFLPIFSSLNNEHSINLSKTIKIKATLKLLFLIDDYIKSINIECIASKFVGLLIFLRLRAESKCNNNKKVERKKQKEKLKNREQIGWLPEKLESILIEKKLAVYLSARIFRRKKSCHKSDIRDS